MIVDLTQISVITGILTEVIKRSPLGGKLSDWMQVIALIISAVLAVIYGYSVIEGLVAGFTAMGLYDTAKLGVSRLK